MDVCAGRMHSPGSGAGNDTWDGYQWSREPWPGRVVSIWYLLDDSLTAHQIFLPSASLIQEPGATAGLFPKCTAVTAHCNDDGDLASAVVIKLSSPGTL